MHADEIRRRSRWMIRALEWDEPRARYPNLWHEGMPSELLVFDTVGTRLRLGDLVAVYRPASAKHPESSERFAGIARVAGLRRARHERGSIWVELETAHRFDPPLDLGESPSRVFLCCDPGWPARDVALFQRVFEAAVTAGWRPTSEETEGEAREPAPAGRPQPGRGRGSDAGAEPKAPSPAAGETRSDEAHPAVEEAGAEEADRAGRHAAPARIDPRPGARLFGGVDYSGDMRDPRDATWFALLELHESRLRVIRLESTGRAGVQELLRQGDREVLHTEAIGLDFPFGLPLGFAEALLGGPFPEEGWWALAKRLEKMTRPEYLVALQEYRDVHGEPRRLTDERAAAFSPLHRVNPDLGPMTFHGIRLLAEERSRFAVRPFESARGRLLMEVYPGASARRLLADQAEETSAAARGRLAALIDALANVTSLPVEMAPPFAARCRGRRDALDAVLAARCAARAVLSGEVDRPADDLSAGEGARIRHEGWIYGLEP